MESCPERTQNCYNLAITNDPENGVKSISDSGKEMF